MVFAPASAVAQTNIDWNNALGGPWSVAGNWSPMTVPNNGGGQTFNATIDLGGTYTVSLDNTFTVTGFRLNQGMATLMGAANTSLTTTGVARLSAGSLVGIPLFESLGTLQFDNIAAIDICDTCIEHRGSTIIWDGSANIGLDQGSELINGQGSTFDITNDQTIFDIGGGDVPVIRNEGTIRKLAGGGVTTIDGIQFFNPGQLVITSGSIVINNPAVSLGRLSEGEWEADEATIDFDGIDVMESGANISLTGPSSEFVGLEPLEMILPGGSLSLSTRRDFTTLDDFTNDGLIRTGLGTTFRVLSGGSLTNFNPMTGELSGGAYDVTGAVIFDDADVNTLSAEVKLNTPAAAFTDPAGLEALRNLETISTSGKLELLEGKDLTVSDDLISRGTLVLGRSAAGDQSILETPTAFAQEDGDVVLQGGRLRAGGTYLFEGGKLSGNGEVESSLLANSEVSPGFSPGRIVVIGQTVVLENGKVSIEVGGLAPIIEHDVFQVDGPLAFQGGSAGTLEVSLLGTFTPQIGDIFQIIQARGIDGQFAELRGLAIDPELRFIPEQTPTGFILRVERVCICDIAAPRQICDIFDFVAFQDQFIQGGGGIFDVCNLNTSTGRNVCDIFDFIAFQDLFVLGCDP